MLDVEGEHVMLNGSYYASISSVELPFVMGI